MKKTKSETETPHKSKNPLKLNKQSKKNIKQNILSKSVKKPKKSTQIATISLLILGIALIPGAIFLNFFIQEEIDKGIEEQILVPTSPGTNVLTFMTNDYPNAPPEFKNFYLWNLTNPDAFLSGEEKPRYEQIGPFTFRNLKYKYAISYDPSGTTVTYKEYNKYEQIGGENISEVYITNINPGFLGAVEYAGGTEQNFVEMNLPFVLSKVKGMFCEEMNQTLGEILTEEGMFSMLNETLMGIINDARVDSSLIDSFLDLLETFYGEGIIETWIENIITYIFDKLLPPEHLINFMDDAMPNAEEVFYEEWANDYFPEVDANLTKLYEEIEGVNNTVLLDILEFIFETFPALKDVGESIMGSIIQQLGDDMVKSEGSSDGTGIDLDGREPYNYPGSSRDLNIANHTDGGSGLTYEQCSALWNESDPNSLLGMDYEINKGWFNALNGDDDAQYFLRHHFNISETQLNFTLNWIETGLSTWLPNLIEYTLNEDYNSGVITNRTAEEWLFTAEDAAIKDAMSKNGKDESLARVNLFDNCKNETEAEEADIKTITIMTGKDNKYLARRVVRYDEKSTINLWQTPETIGGSLGMYNPPSLTDVIAPKIFNPDLMRVIDMVYIGKTSVFGVELNRYTFAPKTFSPNENYYMKTQGLINAQPVEKYKGVPVLVSKPHFLDSDPSVISAIEGIEPNRIDHETYIDVEPISGVTMHARERVQVNFNVSSDEYFTSDINTTVMPIAWYERSGIVPKHLADRFTEEVYPAQTAQTAIIYAGPILGVIFSISGGSGTLNNEFQKSIIRKRGVPKKKKAKKSKMNSFKSKKNNKSEEKKIKKEKLLDALKSSKKNPKKTNESKQPIKNP
jgi:hypothetical protein